MFGGRHRAALRLMGRTGSITCGKARHGCRPDRHARRPAPARLDTPHPADMARRSALAAGAVAPSARLRTPPGGAEADSATSRWRPTLRRASASTSAMRCRRAAAAPWRWRVRLSTRLAARCATSRSCGTIRRAAAAGSSAASSPSPPTASRCSCRRASASCWPFSANGAINRALSTAQPSARLTRWPIACRGAATAPYPTMRVSPIRCGETTSVPSCATRCRRKNTATRKKTGAATRLRLTGFCGGSIRVSESPTAFSPPASTSN